MRQVKIYSNYVRKSNATVLDANTQTNVIISMVRQALDNGLKGIRFEYEEEGPECESDPVVNTGESHTG